MPRVYFQKNGGLWYSSPGTLVSGSATSSYWNFTISAATVSGLSVSDVVSYYVIAQNSSATPAVFSNPSAGLSATDVNNVLAPPTSPNSVTLSTPALGGLTNSGSSCFNSTAAQNVSFPYTSVTGGANQYTVSWSPSGPANVTSFTTLAVGNVVVSVPPATAVGTYSGSLTIKNAINGCTNTYTLSLAVNALPSAITGGNLVCSGSSITLSSSPAGGTWTSGLASVAAVGSATGIVTGSSVSSTNISYMLPTGCRAITTVTVQPLPGVITGTRSVCAGSNTTLADASLGGAWSSSDASIASVSTSGIVTGVNSGIATITYTIGTGCFQTAQVTVNPMPNTIGGTPTVCVGSTVTLTETSTGGTWLSSTTGVATVGANTGVTTGIGAGTSTISYKFAATGCIATTVVTVLPIPATIASTNHVCIGSTITLTNTDPSGTWTSNAPSIANIDLTSGVVNGVTTGAATITYTLPTGCFRTLSFVVNPLPAGIGGSTVLCLGATVALTDASTGGTWTSGNPGMPIGPTNGILTGMTTGIANISYTLPTGCVRTTDVTVNPLPDVIGGPTSVCVGSSISLLDATAGGTWTSSSVAIASAGSATGVITGVTAGVVNITYTLSTGCKITTPITVSALPGAISGGPMVCQGSTLNLSSPTAGGTWTSSDPSTATIDAATAILSGIAPGTTIISYTVPTGCRRTVAITVNPAPAAISGSGTVCVGATTTLTDITATGTWSSGNNAVAQVGSLTGVVSGIVPGTATINFNVSSSCHATHIVTVYPLPGAVTGPSAVCLGGTITMANTVIGGSWSSSTSAVATIDAATGVLTSITPGTSVISYTLSTGCYRTTTISVNALPSAITGSLLVCAGSGTTLSSATGGGSWSTSNSNAFATAGGVIAGVSPGTATVTYTAATGCITTAEVTVSAIPEAITGTLGLCSGTSTALATVSTGGAWNSSNPSVATVNSTGIVGGIAPGMATISYSFAGGCKRTVVVTVNPLPGPISGSLSVCAGQTGTLSNSTTPGTWSSSNTTVALVGSGSGVVTGLAAGTSMVTYTTAAGCKTTATVIVNLAPSNIIGNLIVCAGRATTLSNSVSGGTWSTTSMLVGVDPVAGVVVSTGAGSVTISYTLINGCRKTAVLTINPLPAAITGPATVCVGSIATLGSATIGGTWSSSTTSVASSTLITGYITGVSIGTSTVDYTLATGCLISKIITVNPLPLAIAGTPVLCAGATTTLSDATPGGSWSASNYSVGTVGAATGVVTGMGGGTVTISYTLPTSCRVTQQLTVNPNPPAIGGTPYVCIGTTTHLVNAIPGGTWSTSNASVAVVDPLGNVSGIDIGTALLTYAISTGCYTTIMALVNPLPAPIAGPTSVCVASSINMTSTPTGGTWSTSIPTVATAGLTSGVITGVATGSTLITYRLTTGCIRTTTINVNPLPAPIGGGISMCAGLTTTLTDITPSGTWSSGSTSIATVGSVTGEVNGIAGGTATMSYTLGTGCYRTKDVTVNPLPSPITGDLNVCVGATTIVNTASSGGIWTGSDATKAYVGASSGVITGVALGTLAITYTLPTGCVTTAIVTVHPTTPPITGMGSMCAGSSISLSNASTGGTWMSGQPSIAEVDPTSGVVTGTSTGIASITYTNLDGCHINAYVTVNLSPSPISGATNMCAGYTTTLHDFVTPGIWHSGNPTIATIDSLSGVASGLGVGTSTISYTVAGCTGSIVVTVNLSPSAISGPAILCHGSSAVLANAIAGGTWSTSNSGIVFITATGGITGVSVGTAVITYTLGANCHSVQTVTITNAPPFAAIAVRPNDTVVCKNTLFQNFGANAGEPAGVNYTWTASNATIYKQSADKHYALISFPHTGTSVVTLSSSLSSTGCSLKDSVVIHVGTDSSTTPAVSYYNDMLVCSDNTADSYQWGYDDNITFDSTLIEFATFQNYLLTAPDFARNAYWVMTNHNGCKQKSYYNAPTAIQTPVTNGGIGITLYPNPATDQVSVALSGLNSSDIVEVVLTDISGKDIHRATLTNGKATLNVQDLAPGTYVTAFYRDNVKIGSRIFVRG
jgi:uncharacterized protein YjdB